MELIFRECSRDHDFPEAGLEVTGTETDRQGRLASVSRASCRKCGMVKVMRWLAPDPAAPARRFISAAGTYERPLPADVPGLAERAALITDEQHAQFAAECGFPSGMPRTLAPDLRASAPDMKLELAVRIRAGQFALIDRYRPLGQILPLPVIRDSTDLIDAALGGALFWPPVHDGELALTMLIFPRVMPAPDRSYPSISEVSCRFQTGYVVLKEIGGRAIDLPPLPAGHGDYRLRFHSGEADCLLQIWPQPRGKPRARV